MSQTTVINNPFPPTGTQVVGGGVSSASPGTLSNVKVPGPLSGNPPYGRALSTGSAAIDVSFYDSIGPTSSAPIAVVTVPNGYGGVPLSVAYQTGLYMVARSSSDIAVTHS